MKTLYVSKYKEYAYTTILEALEHANEHDVIEISSGTYDEVLVIRKPITFHGHGIVKITGDIVVAPKVAATMQNIQFNQLFELKDATAHFEGCHFHTIYTTQSVMVEQATVSFTDCQFNSDVNETSQAFVTLADSQAQFIKCQFIGNKYAIFAKGSTIKLDHSVLSSQADTQVYLENTTLHTSYTRFQSAQQAIQAIAQSTVTVAHSFFAQHKQTQLTMNDGHLTLHDSQLQEAKHHVSLTHSNAVVHGTLFTKSTDTQISLSNESTFNAKHTDFTYGDSHAIKAVDSAIHLKQCNITQHKAKDKAQLHIYHSQLHIDDTSISRGLQRAIFAEVASTVTLYKIKFATHHAVQLEMIGGRATITHCEFQAELSSAILLVEDVEATITSCTFLISFKNHITLAAKSNVTIADCRFDRCGGNDINAKNVTLTLRNLIVHSHPSKYPSVYVVQTQFTIDQMSFANCKGIALQLTERSNGTAQHLTFHNNQDINIDLLNSESIFKDITIQDGTYGIYANNSKLTINQIVCDRQSFDGIHMIENGHLLLSNGCFKGAQQYGLASEYCTLSIEHSQFTNNKNGLYTKGTTVTMNDSQIMQNEKHGIETLSSSFNLCDTLFSYNTGIQFEATRSTLQFQNTFFDHGKHAIVLHNKVNATFNHVACTDHQDTTLISEHSTLIGKKCLFANGQKQGVFSKGSQLTFTDSRFNGHLKDEFFVQDSSEAVLTDCSLTPSRKEERGATILDQSTVSLNGYMMYRKRSS